MIDNITLQNFRCFLDIPKAPLAPLTLLVGENSTGKTSFMAMIRILWGIFYDYQEQYVDFAKEPYNLGTFNDIAHYRGGRGSQAELFSAGFVEGKHEYQVEFKKKGTLPIMTRRNVSDGTTSIEEYITTNNLITKVSTPRGRWKKTDKRDVDSLDGILPGRLLPLGRLLRHSLSTDQLIDSFISLYKSPNISSEDLEQIRMLSLRISRAGFRKKLPYASAPVRSKPRRTYEPSLTQPDTEGETVPSYLANEALHPERWKELQRELEETGQRTGLFDGIRIKKLGDPTEPFQIQIRKGYGPKKGSWRNLIDVGYGVSQLLPLITELSREKSSDLFLLQQPEIHLHPKAQAELGSLLCQISNNKRQLIIETHSNYLIDRVRMQVRDEHIKPTDVSLLYFERQDLDVVVYSMRFDKEGNLFSVNKKGDISDIPPSYNEFFMEELERSIWKQKT